MRSPVKKRPYVSPARQAKAQATRARIIDAASVLFLEGGYGPTSTAAIARAAGVSEASVFAVFGSKADLLIAVTRDHVVRDSDFPIHAQPIWRELASLDDKAPAIEAVARIVRRAHDRSWRLLALVAAASLDDPAVASAHGRAAASRRDDCAWFVHTVMGIAASDDAERRIDEMWTLISVENYRHLVVERSWPAERYEAWLAATLTATLR